MKIKLQLNENISFEGEELTEEHVSQLINILKENLNNIYNEKPSQLHPVCCSNNGKEYIDNSEKLNETKENNTFYSTLDIDKKPVSTFGVSIGEVLQNALLEKNKGKQIKRIEISTELKPANISQEEIENNDFITTGIKYRTIKGIPNVPTYRCHWECPNPLCNDKGNHYIPEGTKVVFCYTCNTPIQVEDAAIAGFPNRDEWGNYYIAVKEMEEKK